MNNRGQVIIYGLMLGITIVILALALAGPVKERVENTISTNSIEYKYYYIRDFFITNENFAKGNYTINNDSTILIQEFRTNSIENIQYTLLKNITLKGYKYGSPVGNITFVLRESISGENITSISIPMSSFSTSTSNITSNFSGGIFLNSQLTYNGIFYFSMINNTDYLNLTKNIIIYDLWTGNLYNSTDNLINTILVENTDLYFKIGLSDNGIEHIGLDCSNGSISNFDRATCLATDLTLFQFVGGLIFMAGALVTARIIFGD
jgi:hypothetical protein